ncbi:MAG: peptidase M28, partial [Sphingopyxis sp.]|nr:peptidase M28 [Sphingopyxis sp.]
MSRLQVPCWSARAAETCRSSFDERALPVRGGNAMRAPMKMTRFSAAVAAVALVASTAPAAFAKGDAPVTEAELAKDIKILSSDAFEGRGPGTEGEDRTIAYIVGEWAKLGLEPVPGSATPWLQGVPLVETQATGGTATFRLKGSDLGVGADGVLLTGRDARVSLANLPVVFVGYGLDGAGKVNADVSGKVAVMLYDNAPFGENLPRYRERRQKLADAGASAVLVVATDDALWSQLQSSVGGKATRLASAAPGAPVTGFLSPTAADTLFQKPGQDGA